MRLLLITQALDLDDPTLSVYHGWVAALAERVEQLEVICLYEGRHDLPASVRVHSLGKERGKHSALVYIVRFLRLTWKLRTSYDEVFVHMNQEYILIAGLLWRFLGKRIYLWRNHYAGNILTRIAVWLSTTVFCTSQYSYTARFAKTKFMPVGIDFDQFFSEGLHPREPRSILFLARIAPSKRPEMFIDALGEVLARGISFTASLYGSPRPEDAGYAQSLVARAEARGLRDRLHFHEGVPNTSTPAIYRTQDIFVNCSRSGMFDKTLFEAAAAGCRVIASSEDFKSAAGQTSYFTDTKGLTECLIQMLGREEDSVARDRIQMQSLARGESLATLADRLVYEFKQTS